MKGLSRNHFISFIHMFVLGVLAWIICEVDATCSKSEKKLWAYSNPTIEHFTDSYKKYLSSDKGEHCQWVIVSTDEDTVIKLTFSNFKLKNSTKSDQGDCVEIYDGEDKKKLDHLCDKFPQESYTSVNGKIFIIYKRGEVEGNRGFSMTYSVHSAISKAKIIQIAGIIGAILASIGLIYVVLRVTNCCRCLRKKDGIDSNRGGSTTRERDRLVENAQQSGVNIENVPDTTTNENIYQNQNQPSSNGSAQAPVSQESVTINNNTETATYVAHDSDVDSLQDMNELPPSYESLYLNEIGESVAPPQYSPPQHRSAHPPRRVNTFN